MPVFDLTINIITLLVIVGLSVFTGFGIQRRLIAKKNRKLDELEREIVMISADILEVQKEYCELESRVKDQYPDIPVIQIRLRTRHEDKQAKKTKDDVSENKDSRTG